VFTLIAPDAPPTKPLFLQRASTPSKNRKCPFDGVWIVTSDMFEKSPTPLLELPGSQRLADEFQTSAWPFEGAVGATDLP
jgi:hypothetical protein